MTKSLIIGAGISGLLAGTELQAAGHSVTILDKGRGVGGRMATRRMQDGGRADHGAQFFTVRDPQFRSRVDAWLASGWIVEWCRGFTPEQDGYPRYCGADGMTRVAKGLAAALHVQTGIRVTQIGQDGSGWTVLTESGGRFNAENLILTPPLPQSLALLKAGNVALPSKLENDLSRIAYDPIFAVLVRLSGRSGIPAPGGVQVRGEPIDWIGDNEQKGISAGTTVSIHASARFTRDHLEGDRTLVAQTLIAAAAEAGYFQADQVVETQVHRWLYAQPIECYPEQTVYSEIGSYPLLFAGDAFAHARVEGAALSGLAAAERLLAGLAQDGAGKTK